MKRDGPRAGGQFIGYRAPKAEPAIEHFRSELRLMFEMGRDRIALVATTRPHDRRPEGSQQIQVMIPVDYCVIEDWSNQVVPPNARIESENDTFEIGFVDFCDAVDGAAPGDLRFRRARG